MSELDNYDLPFSTANAKLLSGGSRSRGYRISDWIVRVPTKSDFLLEQQREANISGLLHKELPENLRNKVTNIHFNGKCFFHREIIGKTLQTVYKDMTALQRNDLAKDIAELLYAIHNIPLSAANKAIEQYSKVCRDENKTILTDFDYTTAKQQLLECSSGKLNLDTFKTKIPTDGLALCHNDLHAENIIINDCGKLSGFIDFGEAGINPRITDSFHLYRLDRKLMIGIINEYNKISDYKIDEQAANYQFLSNTGYTLEKRKNRANFKSEVANVLQKNAFSKKSDNSFKIVISKTLQIGLNKHMFKKKKSAQMAEFQ